MTSDKKFKSRIFDKVKKDENLFTLVASLGLWSKETKDDVLVIDEYYDNEELKCLIMDMNNNFIEFCGNYRSISLMLNDETIEIIVVSFSDNYEVSLRINKKHDLNKPEAESNVIYMRMSNTNENLGNKFVDMKVCGNEVSYLERENDVICNTHFDDVYDKIYDIYTDDKNGILKIFIEFVSKYNKNFGKIVDEQQKAKEKVKAMFK